MRVGVLLVVGCGLIGVGAVEARTPAQEAPAAAAEPIITDGATSFKERGCAQCHQINGVGGHKGPNLSGIGRRSKKDVIETQIVKGSDSMPEFGDVLPAAEIKVLVNFLHQQKAKVPAWPAGGPVPPVAAPKDDSPGV